MSPETFSDEQESDSESRSPGSVSIMIDALKRGEDDAAADLWNLYFRRLVPLAKKKMGTAARKVADEEDVALSVMNHLLNGAARGSFPQLADRDELWKLLIVLTQRKVTDQIRRDLAQKRGGRNVRGESVFLNAANGERQAGWDTLLRDEPTPETLAEMDERCGQLFAELGDPILQQIAQLKLESYTNEEIGARLGVTPRTIKRKCQLIKEKWLAFADREVAADDDSRTGPPA